MGFDHCFFGPNSSLQSGQISIVHLEQIPALNLTQAVFKQLALKPGDFDRFETHLETHNYPC